MVVSVHAALDSRGANTSVRDTISDPCNIYKARVASVTGGRKCRDKIVTTPPRFEEWHFGRPLTHRLHFLVLAGSMLTSTGITENT